MIIINSMPHTRLPSDYLSALARGHGAPPSAIVSLSSQGHSNKHKDAKFYEDAKCYPEQHVGALLDRDLTAILREERRSTGA